MILTELSGGLGNQMFQYAMARKLQGASSNPIVLDTRRLRSLEADIEKIEERPYAIDIFPGLNARVIDSSLRKLLDNNDFYARIKRKIMRLRATRVGEFNMAPVRVPAAPGRNLWLQGYFQSERYFQEIRHLLLADFSFPELDDDNLAIECAIVDTADVVAIHIRRGDYLSSRNRQAFGSVSVAYYQEAVARLLAEIQRPQVDVIVFSDDVAWARDNIGSPRLNCRFVEGNDGANSWKDMRLMSRCQHHIIANSTFSWWGAWLAQRPGLRFAPMHWFRPGSCEFDIHAIVPRDWKIVDFAPS